MSGILSACGKLDLHNSLKDAVGYIGQRKLQMKRSFERAVSISVGDVHLKTFPGEIAVAGSEKVSRRRRMVLLYGTGGKLQIHENTPLRI